MLVCCFYDILFEQRIYDMIWYDDMKIAVANIAN